MQKTILIICILVLSISCGRNGLTSKRYGSSHFVKADRTTTVQTEEKIERSSVKQIDSKQPVMNSAIEQSGDDAIISSSPLPFVDKALDKVYRKERISKEIVPLTNEIHSRKPGKYRNTPFGKLPLLKKMSVVFGLIATVAFFISIVVASFNTAWILGIIGVASLFIVVITESLQLGKDKDLLRGLAQFFAGMIVLFLITALWFLITDVKR